MTYLWITLQVIAYLLLILVMVGHSIFSSEYYLHRHLTHKSVPIYYEVGLLCEAQLALFIGISREKWRKSHLHHHLWADTSKDLYRPCEQGLWKIFFFTIWYWHKGIKKNEKAINKIGGTLKKTWLDRFQSIFRFGSGGLILLCLIFGWKLGIAIWLGHYIGFMLYYGYVSAFTHNGKEHKPKVGRAINQPLGWFGTLISLGGDHHENHHKDMSRGNYAFKEGEIDPLWVIITKMQKIGLAPPT